MLKLDNQSGFSLVEILVSLLVVSLAAANVAGLQKMVSYQNRDNVLHTGALQLAIEKMDGLLDNSDIAAIDAIDSTGGSIEYGTTKTKLNYKWTINTVGPGAGADIRDVKLAISWNDAKGDLQTFTYCEQVNVNFVPALNILVSLLKTNNVIYFEPKMGYKIGAFVIYNSQLFQATSVLPAGNLPPSGDEDSGWINYGPINNPELANNENLATLFEQ